MELAQSTRRRSLSLRVAACSITKGNRHRQLGIKMKTKLHHPRDLGSVRKDHLNMVISTEELVCDYFH